MYNNIINLILYVEDILLNEDFLIILMFIEFLLFLKGLFVSVRCDRIVIFLLLEVVSSKL